MPQTITGAQFEDEGVGSLYPFADTATLAGSNQVTLDRDMFLDAIVYPIGGGARMGVTAVERVDTAITLSVGTPENPRLCQATWSLASLPAALTLTDAYHRPAGSFLCDPVRMAVSQTWPEGVSSFATGAAELVATVCIPVRGDVLQGFLLEDGSFWTKDVLLVGRDGVVVGLDEHGNVQVSVTGDALSTRRLCGPVARFVTPNFVKTINGIAPDAHNNWSLNVADRSARDTVLRIVAAPPDTLRMYLVGRPTNAALSFG